MPVSGLQILGVGADDMMPSLFFYYNDQRYLFNCPEGTQRFCTEQRVRFSKISKIFMTNSHPDYWNGLFGAFFVDIFILLAD